MLRAHPLRAAHRQVMRLLSLFTMGVPSTESAVPMAHLLPLILSTLLCLGGSLLYASDWTEVRKRIFTLERMSFYQDRLWTNTGKALTKRDDTVSFQNFPLNAVSFMVLFAMQFCFLAQG